MAFLDNSGDIILDAVLTDTGRLRLAQGDGSFKISKFALGDDEINYALYNKNHASGSAYYDLEILQTPVLEAFTNNSAQIKSRLMTISRTNILFMPILKLNNNIIGVDGAAQHGPSRFFFREFPAAGGLDASSISVSRFYIAADELTFKALKQARTDATNSAQIETLTNSQVSIMQGYSGDHKACIRVDQGLDTEEIHPTANLDDSLVETAFLVELDYRLGSIKQPNANTLASVNFIDDDNIASYYLTETNVFINPRNKPPSQNKFKQGETDFDAQDPQVFSGPRGNTLQFRVQASTELQSSTYLYTQIGNSVALNNSANDGIINLDKEDAVLGGRSTVHYIDSTIRVIGANTGFRLDIPVRYVKIA
jgi:hypothetical protein